MSDADLPFVTDVERLAAWLERRPEYHGHSTKEVLWSAQAMNHDLTSGYLPSALQFFLGSNSFAVGVQAVLFDELVQAAVSFERVCPDGANLVWQVKAVAKATGRVRLGFVFSRRHWEYYERHVRQQCNVVVLD